MSHRRASLILTLFIAIYTLPLGAIELILNQRQIGVYPDERLLAHTYSEPETGGIYLPLSGLFPWMKEIEALEVKSAANLTRWDSPRQITDIWNDIKLVHNSDGWELSIGQDIFKDPMRIAVLGTEIDTPVLRIWSSADDIREELAIRLDIRGVEAEWRTIHRPGFLLNDPPQGTIPHLILMEDISLIRSLPKLFTYRPIAANSSLWLTSLPAWTDSESGHQPDYPQLLAINLRDPVTSLYWLPMHNPFFLDTNGRFSSTLINVLTIPDNYPDAVIDTPHPLQALNSGRAMSAALSAASVKANEDSVMKAFRPIPPPEGGVNILRRSYAAIPKGLAGEDIEIAKLILNEAVNLYRPTGDAQARPIPPAPRLLSFFDAYTRIIGPALSRQLGAAEAAEIIGTYVNGRRWAENFLY